MPLKSFGFYVQPVDAGAPEALASLNAEQPFLLASTTKLVTSLAALDLLGSAHHWRTEAFATAPVVHGRLKGDLVLVGGGAGLTPAELGRWFRQMRAEGLSEVSGRIVLERLPLLHAQEPAQAATTAAERSPETALDPRTYNKGKVAVGVAPAPGAKAAISLHPHPSGVVVVNEVAMGGGSCAVWARWQDLPGSGPPQLRASGRWDVGCGTRRVAALRPPPSLPAAPEPVSISTPRLVAALWTQAGGKLRGRVVTTDERVPVRGDPRLLELWSSEVTTPLRDVIHEMNKTSNNVAARSLLLSMAPRWSGPTHALREAQDRVHAWLRRQGLADDDIRVDEGSGQSRAERGKPRAMVALLRRAWRITSSNVFLDSLPVAGVDGTLAHRMRQGSATGRAHLKTGTLRDTRALAGYVRAASGKVYAVAAIVNHPQASRATPALDAAIEWVAKNG
ncbi:D-alanyl-D-alanine carboxypeptidase/D-alanyl-D-alanine-endopeptidase [Piscinibacter sp.]|uniref:D-alanyl-D-alanine carboxypeptidase/D-alanyl-D-alanine-endopeptidase n=1 Tax=Piscinibacter sp. TaxID=1903157 RepID=UPI002CB23156|nr:D-alanyl-D-alanine carboxypeptidase [Albitalea sp.]HUG24308.1 D-alanyl-D-alanine carboxypeptidase [Albitalea sp.]